MRERERETVVDAAGQWDREWKQATIAMLERSEREFERTAYIYIYIYIYIIKNKKYMCICIYVYIYISSGKGRAVEACVIEGRASLGGDQQRERTV